MEQEAYLLYLLAALCKQNYNQIVGFRSRLTSYLCNNTDNSTIHSSGEGAQNHFNRLDAVVNIFKVRITLIDYEKLT